MDRKGCPSDQSNKQPPLGGEKASVGTAGLLQNQAQQQQAAGWGKSAAAVGLVSRLPESDEWSRGRKKATKVSLILMQLHFFFFFLADH